MNFIAKRRERQNRRPDRGELVASARRAFTDLGPAASMAEIAAAAGVSEAELAVHFGDRDALLVAVIDDLEGSLREEGPVARAPIAPPRLWSRQMVPPLIAAAAVLSLGTAPPSSAAADEPAPATVLTISPLWPVWSIDTALEGSMCATNHCSMVPYVPFVTYDGVRALDARLSQTTGVQPGGNPTVVLGFSNGAMVAQQWMADNAGKPGAPSPEDVSFVLIGNPRRAYGGTRPPITPTDYHVIDIVRQYDPMADFPDNPLNLLALANVAAGMLSPIHLDYRSVDLDDPANVVWTEGNTTYVFVPTPDLPLLRPLRAMGMTALADALNEPLKEIVERAYDRPYLATPAEPSAPPEEPASADVAAVGTAAAKTVATTAKTVDTAEETVSTPPRRKLFSKRVAAEEDTTATEAPSKPAADDAASTEPAEKPTTATDTPEAAATPKRDTTASSTSKTSAPHRWGRHRQE